MYECVNLCPISLPTALENGLCTSEYANCSTKNKKLTV